MKNPRYTICRVLELFHTASFKVFRSKLCLGRDGKLCKNATNYNRFEIFRLSGEKLDTQICTKISSLSQTV